MIAPKAVRPAPPASTIGIDSACVLTNAPMGKRIMLSIMMGLSTTSGRLNLGRIPKSN